MKTKGLICPACLFSVLIKASVTTGTLPPPPPPETTTTEPVTLPAGSVCQTWENSYPRAMLTPGGCSNGGDNGEEGGSCAIMCQENYDMVFEDGDEVRTETEVTCNADGSWSPTHPFTCADTCPELWNLNKYK